MLDHVANPAAKLRFVHALPWLVAHPDRARRRPNQAIDHPQRSRLATAGRPDENRQLTGRGHEGQAAHRNDITMVTLRHILKRNQYRTINLYTPVYIGGINGWIAQSNSVKKIAKLLED
jgi:hypothetical protein